MWLVGANGWIAKRLDEQTATASDGAARTFGTPRSVPADCIGSPELSARETWIARPSLLSAVDHRFRTHSTHEMTLDAPLSIGVVGRRPLVAGALLELPDRAEILDLIPGKGPTDWGLVFADGAVERYRLV